MAGTERESPVGLTIPPFGKYHFRFQFNKGLVESWSNLVQNLLLIRLI